MYTQKYHYDCVFCLRKNEVGSSSVMELKLTTSLEEKLLFQRLYLIDIRLLLNICERRIQTSSIISISGI